MTIPPGIGDVLVAIKDVHVITMTDGIYNVDFLYLVQRDDKVVLLHKSRFITGDGIICLLPHDYHLYFSGIFQ